jgi:hypothetical protein
MAHRVLAARGGPGRPVPDGWTIGDIWSPDRYAVEVGIDDTVSA